MAIGKKTQSLIAFIDIDEETDDNEDKDAEVTNEDILKELLLTKELIVNSLKHVDNPSEENFQKPAGKNYINEEETEKLGYVLQKAKSIEDIINTYPELVYIQDKHIIVCEYCVDMDVIDKINDIEKVIGFVRTNGIEVPEDPNDKQDPRLGTNF